MGYNSFRKDLKMESFACATPNSSHTARGKWSNTTGPQAGRWGCCCFSASMNSVCNSLLTWLAQEKTCAWVVTNTNLPSHFPPCMPLRENCDPSGIQPDSPACKVSLPHVCFLTFPPTHHNMSASLSRNNLFWELAPGVCTPEMQAQVPTPPGTSWLLFKRVASSALHPSLLPAPGSGTLHRTKPASGARWTQPCYIQLSPSQSTGRRAAVNTSDPANTGRAFANY